MIGMFSIPEKRKCCCFRCREQSSQHCLAAIGAGNYRLTVIVSLLYPLVKVLDNKAGALSAIADRRNDNNRRVECTGGRASERKRVSARGN
jgi:hypothetical protein